MLFCIFITWGVSIQFFGNHTDIFQSPKKWFCTDDVFRHRLFKCLRFKILLDFIIMMPFTCLVRSRSRWFSWYLIWLSRKARQRRKRKGKEKIIIFCLPITSCSCSFPSLHSGPGLRETVSLLDAMWPRKNQWESTAVSKKYPGLVHTHSVILVI